MQALSRSEPRRGRIALLALVGLAVAVAMALGARAEARVAPANCPTFRVLHDDRIGPALFPAGNYEVTIERSGLTCKATSELFARFLEDYDGVLPKPWQVVNEGTGKSSFTRGTNLPGFSVQLTGKSEEGGSNPILGKLCPNTFTVNSSTVVGPLRFTKGAFLIYLPKGSGITCNRAAVLFQKFLGAGGPLPKPWQLVNQTATFYKPENKTRSAFRIEPLHGSGRR
jgi:hypothetical protein